jgi:hypothetical protein
MIGNAGLDMILHSIQFLKYIIRFKISAYRCFQKGSLTFCHFRETGKVENPLAKLITIFAPHARFFLTKSFSAVTLFSDLLTDGHHTTAEGDKRFSAVSITGTLFVTGNLCL